MRFKLGALAALALILGSSTKLLAADLSMESGALLRYDSNVFRISEAAQRSSPHDGDEYVAAANVSANAAFQFGLIKTDLAATVQKNWFRYNDELDSIEYTAGLTGQYDAQSGQINFSADHSRLASSFNDVRVGSLNRRTLTTAKISGSRIFLRDLRIVAGTGVSISKNTAERLRLTDSRSYFVRGGVGYFPSSYTVISLEYILRQGDGLRTREVDIGGVPVRYTSDYRETGFGLSYSWKPSVIWELAGSFGYTKHDDNSPLAADFKGITGEGKIKWSPLERLNLTISGERSFANDSTVFANGIRVTRINGTVRYQPLETVDVELVAEHRARLFRYDIEAADILQSRNEKLTSIGANIGYSTPSQIRFGIGVTHDRLEPDSVNAGYQATQLLVSINALLFK